MSIVLLGSTSGSVTLQEPAVAGTTVIDLPATSGTMAVTGGSPSFANITATGNLTFTGTGNRITGDFSNATIANRVAFQSSTTNGNTNITTLANGTSTSSGIQCYNAADPTNSSFANIGCSSTEVQFLSAVRGTGTYLPMTFYTNGSERARIDTSGNLQMQAGAVMPYAPAPTSIAAATTFTNAQLQAQIISTTGTTYSITMQVGTTLETLATWATTGIGYDFFIINTASGTITINGTVSGVTSLGSMTIATGVSAQFRIRRTSANNFVLYRLG